MRNHWFAVLILFSSAMLSCSTSARQDIPNRLSDAEISKALVGKWSEEITEDGGKLTGTIHYMEDGTLKGEFTMVAGGLSRDVTFSGTWKVSDGVLITTNTKTSAPDVLKVGVSKDPVLSIDEEVFRYKDMDRGGTAGVQKRVKE
jgi:hypothetical protein